MTIEKLKYLKESEDNVEFKEAKTSFQYHGGTKSKPKDRRRCILGYVCALSNEGGGMLVLGMNDKFPHEVVGSKYMEGKEGQLENNIYSDLTIRVRTESLIENNKRVLIIRVPGRPIGKIMKFEGVGLMRTGDSLRPMSDGETYNILNEQEPDFSNTFCEHLEIKDLDLEAIDILKSKYFEKNGNSKFLKLAPMQVLSDLDLYSNGKLKYAALILLGKKEAIRRFLPQSGLVIEYRQDDKMISFSSREEFRGPLFKEIDNVWNYINLRNGKIPVQKGPYILDIPFFNEEVIREGILNAITHRDYRRTSEIFVKQDPSKLVISNPGGFPLGVTIENILTINSTPRNRLLAEILLKAGLVERSGQGVDKMFYQCIAEAKEIPDYSKTDDFQVTLIISSLVNDPAFVLFISEFQSDKESKRKLGLSEINTLNKIRLNQKSQDIDKQIAVGLIKMGLIEKIGRTKGVRYILSKKYYQYTDQRGKYSEEIDMSDNRVRIIILNHLQEFRSAKMKDFIELFGNKFTRNQILYLVNKLIKEGTLDKEGKGKGTVYIMGETFKKSIAYIQKALSIGMEQLKKDAEGNNQDN